MARGSNSREGRSARSESPLQRVNNELDFYRTKPKNPTGKPVTGLMRGLAIQVLNAAVKLNNYEPPTMDDPNFRFKPLARLSPEENEAEKQYRFEQYVNASLAKEQEKYAKIVSAFEKSLQGKTGTELEKGFGPTGSDLLMGDKEGADTSWRTAAQILGFIGGLPKTNRTLDLLPYSV